MIDAARFAIIGAGPIGSALAIYLARAGEDVLLVNRGDQPHVGESLVPLCAAVFADLGIGMDGFLVKYGAVFVEDDNAVRYDFRDALRPEWPHAWQCRRDVLDPRMRDAASHAGARIHTARVRSVTLGERQVLHTDDGNFDCEHVIDAAGRDQLLGRQLGLTESHPDLRNAAVASWYTGVGTFAPEAPGDITVVAFDGGWFWFIPLGDGLTSVGMVARPDGPRGDWDEALRRCPPAAARLREASRTGAVHGASDFTKWAKTFHGPGWSVVGDAATFLDPVFSTGIVLGLWGARWLSEALLGQRSFEDYEARVRDAVGVFEPVVKSFYTGDFLTVAFSQQANDNPGIRGAVVSLLAADVFDTDFTAPRRVASRIPALADRLRR